MIKLSSNGLRGNDLQSFIKRAGHPFVDALRKIDIKPGEIPIHLLALGATEAVGPNRNGDGFKCAACRKYHDTFVKHARFYRDHKNKDKSKSYGIVKHSVFNEAMKRVELLAVLNGTKEAADRNGGLIADKEIDDLESGREIPVSMSCKIAFDICSYCGNKARNRSEYCTDTREGGMCKAGGLKHNITRVLADGHILHADNPDPDFFDISRVGKGADRTAFVFGKAASGSVLSGADLAYELGVTAPYEIIADDLEPDIANQYKLAYNLADTESKLDVNKFAGNLGRSFDNSIKAPITGFENVDVREKQRYLNAMFEQKIAMPLESFLRFTTGETAEKCAELAANVSRHLPGVFLRLAEDENLESLIRNNPCRSTNEPVQPVKRAWAAKYAEDYSLDRGMVQRRVLRSAIRNSGSPVRTKTAGERINSDVDDKFVKLATQFALYEIGLIHDISKKEKDLLLTSELLVGQNYLD